MCDSEVGGPGSARDEDPSMSSAFGAGSGFDDLAPQDDDLDRCSARRDDADFLDHAWAADGTRVVRFDGDGVVLVGEPPSILDAPGDGEARPALFLGLDRHQRSYFAELHAHDEPPSSAVSPDARSAPRGLRMMLGALPADEVRIAAYATALHRWHDRHPHCARCGAVTDVVLAGHVRRCPACGADHYPRTDPAVIVLVTDDDDRALLGRQASWPDGRFSTLAGFVEPGESLEAAVLREVREESGVVVDSVEYVASQPWPFPASLMLGYFARAGRQPAVADGVELAEAAWFTRDALRAAIASGEVGLPPATSISRRLINAWLDEQPAQGVAD
jgi:NAD+ diphosphatase